jgi:hypothetical protein
VSSPAARWDSAPYQVSVGLERAASLAILFASMGERGRSFQLFDMNLGEEWDPLFHMKCCGWVVLTQLYFGRSQPLIDCRHMIVSETRIAHPQDPEITGPAMTLSPGVGWLENQWDDIVEDDVDPVCNALVKHAGFCFEAAPRLLAGLEFEKIVP